MLHDELWQHKIFLFWCAFYKLKQRMTSANSSASVLLKFAMVIDVGPHFIWLIRVYGVVYLYVALLLGFVHAVNWWNTENFSCRLQHIDAVKNFLWPCDVMWCEKPLSLLSVLWLDRHSGLWLKLQSVPYAAAVHCRQHSFIHSRRLGVKPMHCTKLKYVHAGAFRPLATYMLATSHA